MQIKPNELVIKAWPDKIATVGERGKIEAPIVDGVVLPRYRIAWHPERGFMPYPARHSQAVEMGLMEARGSVYLGYYDHDDHYLYFPKSVEMIRTDCGNLVPVDMTFVMGNKRVIGNKRFKVDFEYYTIDSDGEAEQHIIKAAIPLNAHTFDGSLGVGLSGNHPRVRIKAEDEIIYRQVIYKKADCFKTANNVYYPKQGHVMTNCDAVVPKKSIGEMGGSEPYWRTSNGEIWHHGYFISYQGEYYKTEDCTQCEVCQSWYPKHLEPCHQVDRKVIRGWHSSTGKERFYGSSRFALGFEVEKVTIEGYGKNDAGSSVSEEQPLWARIETDSSCGLELISNVYSTRGKGAAIFSEHLAKSNFVNEPYDKTCGGHIGISDTVELLTLERMRPLVPVLYAAFWERLKNRFASRNQKNGGGSHHYSALNEKKWGVEFRLPDAVRNADDLQRRFDFMSTVVQLLRRDPQDLTPEALFNATRQAYIKFTDASPKDLVRYRFLIDGFYDVVVKGESNSILETGAFYSD